MSFQHVVGHSLISGAGETALAPVWAGASQITNRLSPNRSPDIGQIFSLTVRGFLSLDECDTYTRAVGVHTKLGPYEQSWGGPDPFQGYADLWAEVFEGQKRWPEVSELLEISNRQLWEPGVVQAKLSKLGFFDTDKQRWIQNLQFDIPGPADLVRFSVRHLWEPKLLQELGYNAEFPGRIIDVWHAMKGLDYPLFSGPFQQQIDQVAGQPGYAAALNNVYFENLGVEPTWAMAYWWSHWVLPSAQQGIAAWLRLNPNRNRKWDGPEAEGVDFSYDNLQLLLRANDYPPRYRNVMASIGRPIPTVRYVRQYYQTGVYTADEVYDWALRWGYTEQDALDLARAIVSGVDAVTNKPKQCRECKLVEDAYETGVIDGQSLQGYYVQFGLTEEEALARTVAVGLDLQVKRARQVVASVRSRYLSGELDDGQARDLLTQYGLVQDRIQQYLDDWGLEKASRRKQISAQKAQRWACENFISVDELGTRLLNLGYRDADVEIFQAEARVCQQTLVDKARAAALKAQQQVAKQLVAQQKAAAQQLLQARRQLAAHGSPAQLRKWYCEGLIDLAYATRRLEALAWPDEDIQHLLGDCKSGQSGSQGASGTSGGGGQQGAGG